MPPNNALEYHREANVIMAATETSNQTPWIDKYLLAMDDTTHSDYLYQIIWDFIKMCWPKPPELGAPWFLSSEWLFWRAGNQSSYMPSQTWRTRRNGTAGNMARDCQEHRRGKFVQFGVDQ
jgi:hypothetical protein